MSAKASGSAPKDGANGSTQHRSHHDGSSGRAFTEEQKLAVIRVRKCSPTAFYDILGLEGEKKTVEDAGIKKAYRKLSLLTHPDKNGYNGADEAFKMVSRAFQILSDVDKKRQYDQTGGDPDSRFSSASTSSPFSNFARSSGSGRSNMFEEEISPEDLFRQFFGGGMGGGFGGPFGGGMFDNGPGFVFNLGGGPGIRVHQFGGNRPRRRPTGARPTANEPPRTALSAMQNLLPLILLFVFPLLSSFFSGGDSAFTAASRIPRFNIDSAKPPFTLEHVSDVLKIHYYVNPKDVEDYTPRKWKTLGKTVENQLVGRLSEDCDAEYRTKAILIQQAQGWFLPDQEKLRQAERMELPSCNRLRALGGR